MLRNGRETAKNLGCSPIIGTFFGCGRPVCKNTQLSANKHTKARSHCLFVRVSSQKTLAHGNLAWQPVLVQCISRNDNSPHDPFVSLLMFLHIFRSAFSQGPTRLLPVVATCLSQTWSTRSTVAFRFCLKECPLEPNNELKREITV